MDDTLRVFDEKFQTRPALAAVTYHRDVTPEYVDTAEGLLSWGIEVPANPDQQQLAGIALKWAMDVEEIFYFGDKWRPNGVPTGKISGLLNDPCFEDEAGDVYLVEPVMFGKMAMENFFIQGRVPCKWLQAVRQTSFRYNKDKLLFRLCWPKLVEDSRQTGRYTYVGGIAPLTLRGVDAA